MGVKLGLSHKRKNMEEVGGGWRRLHNELRNLYSSPNIVRMIARLVSF